MTEYESQHAAWQKDHNNIIAEMDTYHEIGPTWTVVSLTNNWPDLPTWGDCYDWCIATWGRNNAWVYMGPGKFHFKHKDDAVLFMLKWVR